ncbi:MAG: hypothetical protein K2Q26_11175 [Bdellovibrionales bacterium]|nr:hypothetical protein [Bdellovibrionales bacterium]
MIPNKLIEAVVIFVFLTAATGQLPRLINSVRMAQFQVLKESRSSNWGKPPLLLLKK